MVGNNAWMQSIKEWIEQNHPNLVTTGYKITSSDTTDYKGSIYGEVSCVMKRRLIEGE